MDATQRSTTQLMLASQQAAQHLTQLLHARQQLDALAIPVGPHPLTASVGAGWQLRGWSGRGRPHARSKLARTMQRVTR